MYKITTRHLSLIAVFSVLYFIFRSIPFVPLLGISGGFIRASASFAPLSGLILGPIPGVLAVIFGTFLSMFSGLSAPVFLYLDFLPGAFNALTVGLLIKKKTIRFNLWIERLIAIILFVLTFIVLLSSANFNVPNILWMHVIALAILMSPITTKARSFISNTSDTKLYFGIFTFVFIGSLFEHLVGATLTSYIAINNFLPNASPSDLARFWNTIAIVYPIERIIISIISSFIGVALIKTIPSLSIKLNQDTKQ